MEEGMEGLEKEMEALLASQAELVGSLTHDLKGLLSGIDGGIYIAESGFKKEKPERITRGFEMAKRNMARMRIILSSALYYVKDREIDWQPIDLGEMTASVSKVLMPQASHAGVDLLVKSEAGSFEGGELAVHSLLVNLVEYSLDICALDKENQASSVTLSATMRDEHAVFDVLAQGFSIEEETRQLALGDFYAPKGVDRSHLGLFVAHKLAKSHKGTLSITSSPERGTTNFCVRLPKTRPSDMPLRTDSDLETMFGDE